jgi:hypothetical protein
MADKTRQNLLAVRPSDHFNLSDFCQFHDSFTHQRQRARRGSSLKISNPQPSPQFDMSYITCAASGSLRVFVGHCKTFVGHCKTYSCGAVLAAIPNWADSEGGKSPGRLRRGGECEEQGRGLA